MAIIAPLVGALYLVWQIQKRDLRGWQHYACLTSLVFLISILFLVGSGKVKSFGLAGSTIEVVDQKLEEIRALTEQNKLMSKRTVELVTAATSGTIMTDGTWYDSNALHRAKIDLLKASGLSDSEVERLFDELNKKHSKTNSP